MRRPSVAVLPFALLAAACASRPEPVALVSPPPVVPTLAAPMPAGASPGMAVPARGADGAYLTPNRALSADGAAWHLRTGLNVAALACRGAGEASTVARYNALLGAQRDALAAAGAGLEAEYRAAHAAEWRDRHDDAMTRLYNYWSLQPARDGFCAAADAVLAAAAATPPELFAARAGRWLAALDRPFTDFFAAYDAWRGVRAPVAVASAPRIEVDPIVFRLP